MNRSWIDTTLKIRLPILVLAALATYVITFYVSVPERTNVGRQPVQPINFSHKLHAGNEGTELNIDCRYCHVGAETSRHATIPSLNICMNCHTQARKDSAQIKKLTEYWKSGKAIHWERVYRVPEYVYFDHSVHISKGFDCSQCHGEVATMDTLKQVRRITMGRCIDCHRGAHDNQAGIGPEDKGPTNCSACHR